jgi:F0F1-type ATP synthase beta subunit
MTEIAELEERILSTQRDAVTSVQAVYVPADDMTDPAVSGILSHRHHRDSLALPGRQRDLPRRGCFGVQKQIHGSLLLG